MGAVTNFTNIIEPSPDAEFPAETGRYHLYASYGCPWAHRTLLVRNFKGLNNIISCSFTSYMKGPEGWEFASPDEIPGATLDEVNGKKYLREIYLKANPGYTGSISVPMLWDKKKQTVVNNESEDIIRIFNTAFDDLVESKYRGVTFYPEELRSKIDEINSWVLSTINRGVYKTGFATSQDVYEEHCKILFASLDRVENILAENEFLLGERLTEADIKLFTSIFRFDPAYHTIFKCNLKQIGTGYPNILRWTREIYQLDGVKETTNMDHVKGFYSISLPKINPTQIVPLYNGPDLASPIIKPSRACPYW